MCVIVRVIFKRLGMKQERQYWGLCVCLRRRIGHLTSPKVPVCQRKREEEKLHAGGNNSGRSLCRIFPQALAPAPIPGSTFAEHQEPPQLLKMPNHTHRHSCGKACLSCKSSTCAGKHPEASVFLQNAPRDNKYSQIPHLLRT